jgi:malonate-semialdehyde dehydrogenase (acetylating)/methylmalonate-semialdehyde dehydrogenase
MSKLKRIKNYIGGEWLESKTENYEVVYNPANGEAIAEVPLSTLEDVNQATEVAAKAFESWKNVAVPRRARILFKYQQLLIDNKEELAQLITLENGKALSESRGEVQRGIENVEFAAGAPTLMMGDSLSSIATDVEASNY